MLREAAKERERDAQQGVSLVKERDGKQGASLVSTGCQTSGRGGSFRYCNGLSDLSTYCTKYSHKKILYNEERHDGYGI